MNTNTVKIEFDKNQISSKLRDAVKGIPSAEKTLNRIDSGESGMSLEGQIERIAWKVLTHQGEDHAPEKVVHLANIWGYDAATKPDMYDHRVQVLDYIRKP